MQNNDKKAVILLSGGVDSATAMAIAKHEGYALCALSFDYGQKARAEIEAAKKVAKYLGAEKHLILNLELGKIGGSALTDDIAIPKGDGLADDIPVTYVPGRNTIFLSFAISWAEVLGSSDIFIGVNSMDYSGYPDCRPEYISAFEKMANLATRAGVKGHKIHIQAPLQFCSKAEIILKGVELGMDYSLTTSCYEPSENNVACGECESCRIRLNGFREAGLSDPASYVINAR